MTCKTSVTLAVLLVLVLSGCSQRGSLFRCEGNDVEPNRLFLQQISHDSATIRWSGTAQRVCFGEYSRRLAQSVVAVESQGHYSARLSGLKPDTVYYYSIGASSSAPEDQRFRTAPLPGSAPADGNVRIWIVGDSGTAAEVDGKGNLEHAGEAAAVRDGYLKFNRDVGGNEAMDMFLQLGDTAYPAGTDQQWQEAFFDVYPSILKSVMAVPTIGNHGMGFGPFDLCLYRPVEACTEGPVVIQIGGASMSSNPRTYDGDGDGAADGTGMPYLDIFELPTNGELGGVASGTEQYYSLDYGPLHLVSLDSQLSIQDPATLEAMRAWLVADLQANERTWTIVIFHHPPYSKGENHDSDREQREITMRESFAPVFDLYGVDAVYSGHAHSFERSWYLHGHYGDSDSFDASHHAEPGPDGMPSLGQEDDPYRQVSRVTKRDDRAVYTVAGNAGHTTYPRPCENPEQIYGCVRDDWLAHPAHRTFPAIADDYRPNGIARIGSVVVDVSERSLESRLIDAQGNVLDNFVITR